MAPYTLKKNTFNKMRQVIAFFVLFAFISTSIKSPAYAQLAGVDLMPFMPKPGVMIHLSPEYTPAYLKGIVIHPEDALKFDFIVYKGDKPLTDVQKRVEYKKLTKYFLASLAIPDEDQWVNLSPYEKDRIIKNDFGKTEMGRDLLAQDYMLKQITASLIYPEDNLGKKFWDTIYSQAQEQYGTTSIPVNTFNKVWIIPDSALIYEKGNTAYILKNHLKVMLEEDYLSLKKHAGITSVPPLFFKDGARGSSKTLNTLGSKIVRQIVLPELEREVNEGKNFAALRQVYSGMLLAAWYKRALKESLLSKIYADKAKVKGVDQDPRTNEEIYHQYLRAYKKGVFNFIKEDVDKYTNQTIPRKYFSGGAENDYGLLLARGAVTKTLTQDQDRQMAGEAPGDEAVLVSLNERRAEETTGPLITDRASTAEIEMTDQRARELINWVANEWVIGESLSPEFKEQIRKARIFAIQKLNRGKSKDTPQRVFDAFRDQIITVYSINEQGGEVIRAFLNFYFPKDLHQAGIELARLHGRYKNLSYLKKRLFELIDNVENQDLRGFLSKYYSCLAVQYTTGRNGRIEDSRVALQQRRSATYGPMVRRSYNLILQAADLPKPLLSTPKKLILAGALALSVWGGSAFNAHMADVDLQEALQKDKPNLDLSKYYLVAVKTPSDQGAEMNVWGLDQDVFDNASYKALAVETLLLNPEFARDISSGNKRKLARDFNEHHEIITPASTDISGKTVYMLVSKDRPWAKIESDVRATAEANGWRPESVTIVDTKTTQMLFKSLQGDGSMFGHLKITAILGASIALMSMAQINQLWAQTNEATNAPQAVATQQDGMADFFRYGGSSQDDINGALEYFGGINTSHPSVFTLLYDFQNQYLLFKDIKSDNDLNLVRSQAQQLLAFVASHPYPADQQDLFKRKMATIMEIKLGHMGYIIDGVYYSHFEGTVKVGNNVYYSNFGGTVDNGTRYKIDKNGNVSVFNTQRMPDGKYTKVDVLNVTVLPELKAEAAQLFKELQNTPPPLENHPSASENHSASPGNQAALNPGGIDLNAANLNLQIKRDGKGVPLPINQQDLANIKIDGLFPIIIDIRPATSLPIFAELQNTPSTVNS